LITEITLRSLFSRFGVVADVAIKKIQFNPRLRIQNGYGFVHFPLTADGINAAIAATNLIRQYTIDRVTYDSCLTRSLEYVIATQKDVLPLIEPIRTPGEMMQQHQLMQQQPDSPHFASAQRSPHGSMDNKRFSYDIVPPNNTSPRYQASSKDSLDSGSLKFSGSYDLTFNEVRSHPSPTYHQQQQQQQLHHQAQMNVPMSAGIGYLSGSASPSSHSLGERKSDEFSYSSGLMTGMNSYQIMRKQTSPRSSFNSGYSGHSMDALTQASVESGHSFSAHQPASSPSFPLNQQFQSHF
jgi:bisphosphoglycerate-dependent phosphoglycerate mutase